MKAVAFLNNKGGVGTTSLVYHLAWMYHDLGRRVVAADLDPQSNLTSMFIPEERLEEVWPTGPSAPMLPRCRMPIATSRIWHVASPSKRGSPSRVEPTETIGW